MAKKKHKPEAFIAESDPARYLYLLAREVEWAYRRINRDMRQRILTPEEIAIRDSIWAEIGQEVAQSEEKIRENIEKLRNL
jgi:hypothetical protein